MLYCWSTSRDLELIHSSLSDRQFKFHSSPHATTQEQHDHFLRIWREKKSWEQFEMKDIYLITEVKLEFNNLIHITVPYWLHLWLVCRSMRLVCRTLLKLVQSMYLTFPGVKHGRQSTLLSWTYCYVRMSWYHGLVLGRRDKSNSQSDIVPLATAISEIL